MKTKKVTASLPLLACVLLGIASLGTPFLMASHYITVGDTRYSTDNYLFFLWGKYLTVVGTQQISSSTVMYDLGDFPVYSMILIVMAITIASASLFSGRGLILNMKGRVLKIRLDMNPLWFQMTGLALLLVAYVYLGDGAKMLEATLLRSNYEIQNGLSFDFLLGSLISLVMSSFITGIKLLKDKGEKTVKIEKSVVQNS
jgi:hypothetical protein